MIPRWAVYGLIALVVMVLGAIVFGGPVVGFLKGQVKHWQAKEETAQDTVVSKGAEADAQASLGLAQGQIAERVIERTNTITRYVEKASGAPDAKTPLGPDRQRRVAEHDDSLCEQRPAVCPGRAGAEGDDPGVR